MDQRDVLAERKGKAAARVTFRDAARQYHTENEAGWKSSVYARQWLASLENYAFPKLGNEPTGSISAADIVAVLTPIWQQIPETDRQVRNRICAVLDYAHAKGWRSREAPSGNCAQSDIRPELRASFSIAVRFRNAADAKNVMNAIYDRLIEGVGAETSHST